MAEQPRLRRAGPDDAAKLALLGQATFLTAFAHDHPGDALIAHCLVEHSRERYAGWLADPAYALWLVETSLGAPIGYAMMTPPEVEFPIPENGIELKRIYTLSGWQSAGLGRMLMEAVIAEAIARGHDRLYLSVYESNAAAQRFYARFGFARLGSQNFMVGDIAFTDFVLVCELG